MLLLILGLVHPCFTQGAKKPSRSRTKFQLDTVNTALNLLCHLRLSDQSQIGMLTEKTTIDHFDSGVASCLGVGWMDPMPAHDYRHANALC